MSDYLILVSIASFVIIVGVTIPFAVDAVTSYYWKIKDTRRMVESDNCLKDLVRRADEEAYPIPKFGSFEDFQQWLHSEYKK